MSLVSTAAQQGIGTDAFVAAMVADPATYPDLPIDVAFTLNRAQRDEIALKGIAGRFAAMRHSVGVLEQFAREQGIDAIDSIERGAFLLFPHTAYKSYPLSMLEQGRFDRLTRWMQGLTRIDLSRFDATGIELIDEWIERLEDQTGLQIVHTSGTTGKLSFLPRTAADEVPRLKLLARNYRDFGGANSGPDLLATPYPVIYPSFRGGSSAPLRSVATMAEHVARDWNDVLTLYPDRLSADVASLGGRLRVAEERGELGRLAISPALLARRDDFMRRDAERPQLMDRFFDEALARFAGRDVLVFGVLPFIYDWADAGLARELRGVFGSNSIVSTGGGRKGRDLPDDAFSRIGEFLGFDTIFDTYGMSEMTSIAPLCDEGHYHIPPYIIPYLLDGESSEPLPRTGRQTGRFGFIDLFPSEHWGGFVSGDRVTVAGWDDDASCRCGRTGPFIESTIQRFSELNGGEDKITCAGAPAAQDKAIEYLARIGG